MNELLTIAQLKKVIKDLPDETPCVIVENGWDEIDNKFADKKQSPIHYVTYDPCGLLMFKTCYKRTGQLGLDEYL